MIKTAIFTSGHGTVAQQLTELVMHGHKISVPLVLTDCDNTALQAVMSVYGTDVKYFPPEVWNGEPAEILAVLAAYGISAIVAVDFKSGPAADITADYQPNVIEVADDVPLTSARLHEICRMLLDSAGAPATSSAPAEPSVSTTPPEPPVNPDRQWAERLHVNYDERLIQNPGPKPQSPTVSEPPVYGGTPPAQAPTMSFRPAQVNGSMPPTYLVLSVICTLLCCLIPGAVAIYFSTQVTSRYYAGDLEGAKRNSRRAEIWILVSFVLGVLSATLYLPLMLAGMDF